MVFSTHKINDEYKPCLHALATLLCAQHCTSLPADLLCGVQNSPRCCVHSTAHHFLPTCCVAYRTHHAAVCTALYITSWRPVVWRTELSTLLCAQHCTSLPADLLCGVQNSPRCCVHSTVHHFLLTCCLAYRAHHAAVCTALHITSCRPVVWRTELTTLLCAQHCTSLPTDLLCGVRNSPRCCVHSTVHHFLPTCCVAYGTHHAAVCTALHITSCRPVVWRTELTTLLCAQHCTLLPADLLCGVQNSHAAVCTALHITSCRPVV